MRFSYTPKLTRARIPWPAESEEIVLLLVLLDLRYPCDAEKTDEVVVDHELEHWSVPSSGNQ